MKKRIRRARTSFATALLLLLSTAFIGVIGWSFPSVALNDEKEQKVFRKEAKRK